MTPGRGVWDDLEAAVFDLDGTVVDSADGIVAGFRHALTSVGVAPPQPVRFDVRLPLDGHPVPIEPLVEAGGIIDGDLCRRIR